MREAALKTGRGALLRYFIFAMADVLNVARTLGNAVKLHRAGKIQNPGEGLLDPNPK